MASQNRNTQPSTTPPLIPQPLQPGSPLTAQQIANQEASARQQRWNKLKYFLGLFIVGAAIGYFFFRNKDTQTKVIATISFGLGLPVLAYLTVGRMGFDSAPPPATIRNFLITYGLFQGQFENSFGEGPRMPSNK